MQAGSLDLICIDYLQLMKPGVRAENRTQEIGLITRALKTLAKELNFPVLVAAQLNREVEKRADKRPQLSDLRESGDIEADSDVVIFLHQPDPTAAGDTLPVDLIVAKHRNGPTGTVSVQFRKSVTRFEAKP
jgi:replicative DNA helicase